MTLSRVSSALLSFRTLLVRKEIKSSVFLTSDLAIRTILIFLINVAVARYFGPELMGKYALALSIVVLFRNIAPLGLDSVVVKQLVDRPKDGPKILCTVLLIRFLSGFFAFILALVVGAIVGVGAIEWYLLIITGFSSLLLFSESFNAYFQSRVDGKSYAIANSSSYLCSATLVACAITFNLNVYVTTICIISHFPVRLLGFTYLFKKSGGSLSLNFDEFKLETKLLLSKSWPIVAGSFCIGIYMKIGHIILGRFSAIEQVGYFSISSQLTEIWALFPPLVVASFFPGFIKSYNCERPEFLRKSAVLCAYLFWGGIAISILIGLSSNFLVRLLYGNEYIAVSSLLKIQIWSCVFAFLGALISKLIILLEIYMFTLFRHVLGAVASVLSAVYLIPKFGAHGAAASVLFGFLFSSFISIFLYKKASPIRGIICSGIIYPFRFIIK